jgi:hypothetical protein
LSGAPSGAVGRCRPVACTMGSRSGEPARVSSRRLNRPECCPPTCALRCGPPSAGSVRARPAALRRRDPVDVCRRWVDSASSRRRTADVQPTAVRWRHGALTSLRGCRVACPIVRLPPLRCSVRIEAASGRSIARSDRPQPLKLSTSHGRRLRSDLGLWAPFVVRPVLASFRSSGRELGHGMSSRSAGWKERDNRRQRDDDEAHSAVSSADRCPRRWRERRNFTPLLKLTVYRSHPSFLSTDTSSQRNCSKCNCPAPLAFPTCWRRSG